MKVIVDNFFTIILIANILLSLIIVFRERRETAQTWAWLLVLMFIPILGFILYIFFGRGISKDKIFDLKMQGKIGMNLEIEEDKRALKRGLYPHPPTGQADVRQLIYMLTVSEGTLYTTQNEVTLFTDGREKFDALIDDINHAQNHIHLEYYIYRSDDLGVELRDALIVAAQRGVKVRVLLDAWGSTQVSLSFFDELKKNGGEVAFFFPLFVPYINPRINYRNHRKIVVIDGQIGYTGGFNVGNEYLGLVKKFGYWRDNHLRIYGEAVYSLQNRFLMDWNSQHTNEVSYSPNFFPMIDSTGEMAVQIVTSGPDSEHEQIKMTYLKMISLAKREILIQTPYYIPDGSIHEALKLALLAGVKVHLQIPNKPDHPLVYWATYSFAAELIEYGAIVETYENGFIHAKTMIIDGGVVSVGSANIDVRSFRLDFEVNTLVYDERMASQVRKAFFDDSNVSKQLTREIYENRGTVIKLKEGLARLVSPLL
ncbi:MULTISPECIES: cardiolipin synthase [Enterococcus]|uniref:Cardiolipin synthase n=1 Tax=Enterococcus thailandicus TaxID=417368 RepID=A0A179ER74_ENTTH|nr:MULTISPECIES: cardiolipin synthase [Enterococcus]ASZ06956.1 cardiolipin synthase [Enterococcus thailandicus]MDA3964408.1 cardiolipin synthase [Enterococcus thailandicus]MDK4352459.1 cardiolipin synthase [Enterococcus thailandicus]MDT2735315.1 cardiolipin synthase [Enterococcus thailandicus]MDT2751084.1 cardiolipin synthase [Enterococcus thailandicus]